MTVDVDDIVDPGEIAKRAGVQRTTVLMWRHRYNHFPVPMKQMGCGPLWDWNDILAWLVRYRWNV